MPPRVIQKPIPVQHPLHLEPELLHALNASMGIRQIPFSRPSTPNAPVFGFSRPSSSHLN
jgi:hypothetical protein